MRSAIKLFLLLIVIISNEFLLGQNQLNSIVEKGVIKVGMTGSQPPFCMQSKTDLEVIGFEVDLAELLAQYMNVKLEIVELPFTKLLPALKEGKIDVVMSGMTITTTRNVEVSFVGPYVVSGKSILTNSLTFPKFKEIEKAKDLNASSFRLAALEGSTSEDFVKRLAKRAALTTVKNYNEALELIKSGDVDGLVADYPSCSLFKNSYPKDNFEILDEPLSLESIGMAISLKDPQLLNFMQNFYNTMLISGYLEDLKYDWFEDGDWLHKVDINSLIKREQ